MKSSITRRRLLAGLAASTVATKALAKPPFARGGHPVATPPAGEVTTFQLVENSGATARGFKRIGLPVKEGDMPTGNRLKIQRGGVDVPAQFDQRSSWAWGDSSLRFCTVCIRDADFTASASRTYSVVTESGAFDNSTSMTLATALSGTDFKIEFTNFSGSVTGSFADHAASLNTHAAVPTRITKYESGPVADSWEIWGMASNGGVENTHLKVIWYLTIWKNADGSIADREIGAVVSQDWWSITGKETLIYTATLKNGATVIETYGGALDSGGVRSTTVQHIYHAQWATVRLTFDHQHGLRHWLGGSPPSLTYKPDRTYWILTGLVPPFDLTTTYTMPTAYDTGANNTTPSGITDPNQYKIYQVGKYQPGSAQAHRAAVDGTGGYMGEELIPNTDAIAFATQTASNFRIARVASFVNLHVPEHRRSNRTRTRPIAKFPDDAGASDIANTVCALRLTDERGNVGTPSSYYDFTADGMPTAVNASDSSGSAAGDRDSWVFPPADRISGTTYWSVSNNSTHYCDYGYFMYLHEGERYMLQSIIDRSMDMIQDPTQPTPIKYLNLYAGVPSTTWYAIGIQFSQNSERCLGRGARALSSCVLVPDDDVQAGFIKALVNHNVRFLDFHADYLPASYSGELYAANNILSLWMEGITTLSLYTAWDRTGHPLFRRMTEAAATVSLHWGTIDRVGMAASYHGVSRPSMINKWDASTNDFFPDKDLFGSVNFCTISSATNRVSGTAPKSQSYVEGGTVVFSDYDPGIATIPSEITVGKYYNIINGIGHTDFQVQDPDTASVVTFGSDYTNITVGVVLNSANDPTKGSGIQAGGDDYILVHRAAVILALRHAHPDAVPGQLDKYNAYVNGSPVAWSAAQWAAWNLAVT